MNLAAAARIHTLGDDVMHGLEDEEDMSEELRGSTSVDNLLSLDEEVYYGTLIDHMLSQHDEEGDYIAAEELSELQHQPNDDKWEDLPAPIKTTRFTINEVQEDAWKDALDEAGHLHSSVRNMLKREKDIDVKDEDIIFLFFGERSTIYKILMDAMGLSITEEKDVEIFHGFMASCCLQAAYRISTREAFNNLSGVRSKTDHISEDTYIKLWKNISMDKKVQSGAAGDFFTVSRRDKCVWENLQGAFKEICRAISVAGRRGKLRCALDDDKFWFSHKGNNAEDDFGLSYNNFAKPNRKGICGHTAVSSSLNIPLGIEFERKGDSPTSCFKRILLFLFGAWSTVADMRNVSVFSDRGYLMPSLVWYFLLASGADVVGTIKRAPSWPFTYSQTLSKTDKRTNILPKGAATLWIKLQNKAAPVFRSLAAFAFRSGTENVSMAISSLHRSHHWEGVALIPSEVAIYRRSGSLKEHAIKRVFASDEIETNKEKEKIASQMSNEVNDTVLFLTLKQIRVYVLIDITRMFLS
jgi:hypothetical protein